MFFIYTAFLRFLCVPAEANLFLPLFPSEDSGQCCHLAFVLVVHSFLQDMFNEDPDKKGPHCLSLEESLGEKHSGMSI